MAGPFVRRAASAAVLLAFVTPVLSSCGGSPQPRNLQASVGEDLPATANDVAPPSANNSPMLAADPTNPRFVVLANRVDARDFGCALQVSGDGGGGFIPVDPVPTLPPGAEKCYAPEVAFDRKGVLYYLFVGLHGQANQPMGVFLTSSSNRGRSFTAPRQVLGPHNFGVRMAIDGSVGSKGRIHLVWLAANTDPTLNSLPPPPNPILSAYSDDGGRTFSKPVQVNEPGRQLVAAPALALGPHHVVAVLFYDLGADERDYHGLDGPAWDQPWTLASSASRDGGRTFQPNVVVDDHVVPSERVLLIFTMPPAAIAVDMHGRLFVAWDDVRNGDRDVFVRRSSDGGRTWSAAERVNDDPVKDGKDQYQPRLAVAPDGRVDVVFYDRRNDPADVSNDVFYTSSTDGGRTWAANVRLTSKPSRPNGPTYIGTPSGLMEYGSRLGLLATNRAAVAAWTDTRDAPLPEYQDVFTATVTLAPAKR